MQQDKSILKHLIESVEFWLERVKTQEELLDGELINATTRDEVEDDLARYANNLYDAAGRLNKAVCDAE